MISRVPDKEHEILVEAAEAVTVELNREERLALDLRDAKTVMADAYQAVSALLDHCGLFEHPDGIRMLDALAYGRTEDGLDLLPFPKEPLPSPHCALKAERDDARRSLSEMVATFRPVPEIARRNEASPDIDRAVALLVELEAPQ